jgi:VWFA-related protein
MIRCRRWLVLCSATLGLVPGGMAQANVPGSATASANPDETMPVFHANVNLVLVDVVVRDKGKPVHGLKAADFHVLEDGKEQRVSTFEEHTAADAVEASAAPVLPPHTYTNVPRYHLTSSANVLLLDALNTPIQDQMWVRQRMLHYLHMIPPGTQMAVFTLASRLRMVAGFTMDVRTIEGNRCTGG